MTAELIPFLRHSLRAVLVTAALVYVAMCVVMFFAQSAFIYYPAGNIALTPSYFKLPYEDVVLTTHDSEKIAGWYVPAPEAQRTILFFHGNGGNISDRVDTVRALHELGLAVLIIDYRGYGRSSGRPSEQGTYHDALAAWEYLTNEQATPPEDIVLYGRSLGGAIACRLAVERTPAALIIESAFTCISDMAVRRFPFLPVRLFCRFNYNTIELVSSVRCPVLVAHGPRDHTVPYEHGRRIFAAAHEPKLFVTLPGDHNECSIEVMGSPYQKAFVEFVAKCAASAERGVKK